MASKGYSESQLTKAMLLVLEQGVSLNDAAAATGISKRTIQRYKRRHIEDGTPDQQMEVAVAGTTTIKSKEVMDEVDDALIRRAKFINDVIDTKQVVIDRIRKIAKKSTNLDALQRTVKTLDDLENKVQPDGPVPASTNAHLNIFNFYNQKLKNEGYEGPELSDADIVKGD